MTFRDMVNVIFRYLPLLAVFTMIVIITSGVYLIGAKKHYVSRGKVLVLLGTEQMGNMQFASKNSNVYLTRRKQELNNELQILRSFRVLSESAGIILGKDSRNQLLGTPDAAPTGYRFYLNAVRNTISKGIESIVFLIKKGLYKTGVIQKDPALPGIKVTEKEKVLKYLDENLVTEARINSDTLDISFSFPNPFVAQKVLKIILDSYVNHHIRSHSSILKYNFIAQKMADLKTEYEASLKDFSHFIGNNNIYNDENQFVLIIEKQNNIEQKIIDTKAELSYSISKLKKIHEIRDNLNSYEVYDSIEILNKNRENLIRRLTEARLERESLSLKYEPASRVMEDIQTEIDNLEHLVQEQPKRVTDAKSTRKSETYESINRNSLSLDAEILGLKAKIQSLTHELLNIDAELQAYAANIGQYNVLKNEIELTKKSYDRYFDGYLENSIKNLAEKNKISNLSIVEPPSLTLVPVNPDKKIVLMLTGFTIVAGNLFILLFFTMLDNTITTPEQIRRFVQLPILGIFPMLKGSQVSHLDLVNSLQADLPVLAELQGLFVGLYQKGDMGKTMVICKSHKGEGATLIGFNLAVYAAMVQKKNVAYFDFDSTPMFQDLEFEKSTSGYQTLTISGVTIFKSVLEPGACLDDLKQHYAFIDSVKSKFDFVFINVHSLRKSIDLVLLKEYADSTILIVEAERTKRQVVRHNVDLLEQIGFPNIGVVLNKRRFYIPKWLYHYV